MSTIVDNPVTQSKVIMLNGRYFYNFGKKGRVLTAWGLGGAARFSISCNLNPVLAKLDEKGKKYTVEQVELFERVDGYPPREFFKLRYRLERMLKNSGSYQVFDEYINFEHHAKCSLVEQVMLTTLQLKTAERNNLLAIRKQIERYFSVTSPFDVYGPGESLCNLDLCTRLEIYKARKHLTDYIPF
ncbi:TPA: hypothetical protein O4I98_001339 [Vibrio parahaemolyticus]|nr:hypothetical protein [Vibrio parahaemolyticus]